MACKLSGICPDGVLYIGMAQSLEQARFDEALRALSFNIFPVILMLLHRCGLPWEAAGAWWGVLIASCTVLPIWGWVRRQFDDRVALAACLLYAVHPGLIRWSPEIIRDSTFWFIFALSICLAWRAVVELRWHLFVAAGLSIALASLTRFEGLVLLVPLALWTALRAAGGSRRAVLGAIIATAILPLLLVAIGTFWLRDHSLRQLVREQPLEIAEQWVGGAWLPSMPLMLRRFIPELIKGISPAVVLLWLGGVAGWWRLWRRSQQQALYAICPPILLAIWIHLWFARVTCQRYFFPLAIVMLPFAGLTLLRLSGWKTLRAVPLLLIAGVQLSLALTSDCGFRRATVQLGQWAGKQCGPAPVLLGPQGVTEVVSYYAGGRFQSFAPDWDDSRIAASVASLQPDVVLLPADGKLADGGAVLRQHVEALGFVEVDRSQFCGGCRKLYVLLNTRRAVGFRCTHRAPRDTIPRMSEKSAFSPHAEREEYLIPSRGA
jgi:hypothetical protein